MKIYTRKGDDGSTGLLGGSRVPKHHLRIEAYGTVDELNSHVGLLIDLAESDTIKGMLIWCQDRLFSIGSHLAVDPTHEGKMKLPEITGADSSALENEMDVMEQALPEMRHFILPGGHPTVSQCHITRCVCRRAERLVVALHEQEPVSPHILSFLNRLSDYLFVLARSLGRDLGIEDRPWKPKSGQPAND